MRQDKPGALRTAVQMCMHARSHDPVGGTPDTVKSKAYCCGLNLQARGVNPVKGGKWKETLDCRIVSRDTGVAWVERASEAVIFRAT